MNPDQVVTAFCKAFGKGSLDEAMALVAPDCVYHNIPLEPIKGADAIKQTLAGFTQMLGSMDFQIRHQTAVGNVVMNERVDYFTPPGKQRFGLPVAGVFEVKDGKIVAWRDYFDRKQFTDGTGIPL